MRIQDLAFKASAEERDKSNWLTISQERKLQGMQHTLSDPKMQSRGSASVRNEVPLHYHLRSEPGSHHQYVVMSTESTSIVPGVEQVNEPDNIGVADRLEFCSRRMPHLISRTLTGHDHTALGILHRERTCTAGIDGCEIVIRGDGTIRSSTGIQRLFQGLRDSAIPIRRGWQLQVCREGITAAAGVGTPR